MIAIGVSAGGVSVVVLQVPGVKEGPPAIEA
jgi:hypothetical protein